VDCGDGAMTKIFLWIVLASSAAWAQGTILVLPATGSAQPLFLQDPNNNFWTVGIGSDGVFITTPTSAISPFTPPTLSSPSFTWQLSAGIDGAIVATSIASARAATSLRISAFGTSTSTVTIQDDGTLVSNR
jgi:hypothetical protein